MAKDNIDPGRRKALTTGTAVVGGVGAAVAIWPFLSSMNPSASALAAGAPVEVDISKMEPGQQIQEVWRRKPVWIIRRTPEMVETLSSLLKSCVILIHLRNLNNLLLRKTKFVLLKMNF